MNDVRQTELWVEGFVKAAAEKGVPESDMPQLLKVAERQMLRAGSPEQFDKAFNEALEKAGVVGWAGGRGFWGRLGSVAALPYRLARGALSPEYREQRRLKLDKYDKAKAQRISGMQQERKLLNMSPAERKAYDAAQDDKAFENRFAKEEKRLERQSRMRELRDQHRPQRARRYGGARPYGYHSLYN